MRKIIVTALAAAAAFTMTLPVFADPADDTQAKASPEVTASPEATASPSPSSSPSGTVSGKYSFTDISAAQYSWAADYIQEMYEEGYVTGYEDNTYRPDNEVTRQECLSLFARAMGSGDEANKEILEMAHEEYDDRLKSYGLTWGQDEIVYLMYKGVLKDTDLVTYLKNDEKSKPMSRYEAAIIITKAMGGEEEASSSNGVSLSYDDATTIPVVALGYVKYVTDNGIMQGMDGNKFSPNTSVLRSQIAVMLSRVVDKCDYTFAEVKLSGVDTGTNTITVRYPEGTTKTYVYRGDTVMKAQGVETRPEDMVGGVSAVIALSGDRLVSIDALSNVPDETVVGKYQSYSSTTGTFFVSVIPTGETDVVTYECAPDVTITFDGSPATIRSFSRGDFMSLSLSGGLVETIEGSTRTETITGAEVEEISISPKLTMTIAHANSAYDGMTYDVDDSVTVSKNGAPSTMDEIYRGDKVTLTLEYGVITKVSATSTSYIKEGTITSITYSDRPSIVIAINGENQEFEVPSSCTIVSGQSNATLYDFRVGDRVKVTVESDAVTRIEVVSSASTTGSITGKVQSINSSYGFISVLTNESSVAQTVFCRDNTTKFLNATTGDTMTMKNINEGDTVQVNGSYSNGAFVAKVVLVTPAN